MIPVNINGRLLLLVETPSNSDTSGKFEGSHSLSDDVNDQLPIKELSFVIALPTFGIIYVTDPPLRNMTRSLAHIDSRSRF